MQYARKKLKFLDQIQQFINNFLLFIYFLIY
jgi:hypothetical protein